MDSVPKQMGGRFIYSHVDIDTGQREIKRCFELLLLARVCHQVLFRTILVDTGLASVQLGLSQLDLRSLDQAVWANKGALAEQFVGQQLRCITPAFEDPRLFYWQRTDGHQAEIDYIIQKGNLIIPIEVNAGKSGAMKSLHAFMYQKKLRHAIRLDTNQPSVQVIGVKTTTGDTVSYNLLSLPLYMTESIPTGIERLIVHTTG